MQASDRTLQEYLESGRLKVEPPGLIQPASIDLHLDNRFIVFSDLKGDIDPLEPQYDGTSVMSSRFVLGSRMFALASTLERVTIDKSLVARIEGKSSLGRLGLLVHATAGFVDPGWDGWLTLELYNVTDRGVVLHAGMPIAQLAVSELSVPSTNAYSGRYKIPRRGPTPSKYHLNQKNIWSDIHE